jgi:tetratricopeptide (TPR) repeat protein
MGDIFISYAREDDETFVRQLRQDLVDQGLRVWWDRAAMESRGRTFVQEIRTAISAATRVIVVVGPAAARSDYVRLEWRDALDKCKVVVPILRGAATAAAGPDDYSLVPPELSELHCPDFRRARPYDDALGELVRVLRTPVAEPAALSGVMGLPPHYLVRSELVVRLKELVLAHTHGASDESAAFAHAGVHGMGGVGKSVLTAAVVRSCETRRAFDDGIVWLSFGPEPRLLGVLARLGAALRDSPTAYLQLETAVARMPELLADKDCLVILDDVWNVDDVEIIRDAAGPRCRLLITTRDLKLVNSLGAQALAVDLLSDRDALRLLADWAGQPVDGLPEAAARVASACGNLPLALSMIGAMARPVSPGAPARWNDALSRLEAADLRKIREKIPNYPYPDLLKALLVSVDALEPEPRRRYFDFAVFPPAAAVPELALETLWEPEGLSRADTHDLVALLVARSLLRQDERGLLSLHDLQRDLITTEAGDPVALHRRWLSAYARRCPDGWPSGPDDGYFHDHLAWHLVRAGEHADLYALIKRDWMKARFARGLSHQAFAEDLELAIETAATARPPNLLQHFKACFVYATLRSISSEAPVATLEVLARLGQGAQALGYARLIAWPPTRCDAMRIIGKSLFDRGDEAGARGAFEQALQILEALEPDFQKVSAVRDLASTLAGVGDSAGLARIVAQADDFDEVTQRIDAVAGLSQSFAAMGDLAAARELARRALEDARPHPEPLTDHLLDIALCFAKSGETSQAMECFDTAMVQSRSDAEAGGRDEELSFRLAAGVQVLVALGDLDAAVTLADSISTMHDKAGALAALSRAFADTGHRPRATALAKGALAVTDLMRRHGYGPVLQVGVDADVCASLAEVDEIATATALARRALDSIVAMETQTMTPGLNQHGAIGTIARVLASLRDTDGLERALVIASAVENGDENYRATAKGHLALAWLQMGDERRAKAILNDVLAEIETVDLGSLENARAKAFGAMAAELALLGQVDHAVATAEAIEDHEYYSRSRISALVEVIRALLRSGSAAAAEDIAARALTSVHQLAATTGQAESLGEIATALAEGGEQETALVYARRALETALRVEASQFTDWKASLLGPVARPFFAAGNRAGIDAVVSVAKSVERPREAANALCDIAAWATAAGATIEAAELARLAVARAQHIPDAGDDSAQRSRATKRASIALARSGSFDEAFAAAGQIRYVQDSIEAYSELSRAGSGASMTDVAEAALQRALQDLEVFDASFEYDYSVAVGQIVPPLHDAGHGDQATRVLDDARERARRIDDPQTRATALRGLAVAAKHVADVRRASEAAGLALEAARGITDPLYAPAAFRDAIEALLEAGQRDAAFTAFGRACDVARRGGRELLFEVLQHEARLLAGLDQGETLWNIFNTIETVDSWWASAKR